MKGFTRDHKFVPMTDYKKVTRKSRDPEVKTQGVVIRKQRSEMASPDTSDMASFILQNTDDGDDLGNAHLNLLQGAVNGSLTEKGLGAFRALYSDVKGGTYHKPFFHGIQNMTQDQEGFIYWKGIQVEHYSYDDYQDEDLSARELAEVIKSMESLDIPVTSGNIFDHRKWFLENNPQWKRPSFLVVPYDKEGRSIGYEWVEAIDRNDAKKQFERRNKAGTFRQEYNYDKLESMSSEEQQRKQQEAWEGRTRRKRDENKTFHEINMEANKAQDIALQNIRKKEREDLGHKLILNHYWNDKVHPMGSSSGTMIKRKDLDPDGYKKAMRDL